MLAKEPGKIPASAEGRKVSRRASDSQSLTHHKPVEHRSCTMVWERRSVISVCWVGRVVAWIDIHSSPGSLVADTKTEAPLPCLSPFCRIP